MEERSLTDFINFPGTVINNIYIFPKLFKEDSLNRKRETSIFIKLEKNGKKVVIKDSYFNLGQKIDSEVIAIHWKVSGLINGKKTKSEDFIVDSVKNENKKNERNVLQSALIKTRSLWIKLKESGCLEDGEVEQESLLYNAMTAHKFTQYGDRLTYPVYIQPKLDGVRCLSFYGEGKVNMYSRGLKLFNLVALESELIALKDYPNLYIDGELFHKDMKLQDIVGESRSGNDENCKYYLYDCFYSNKLNEPYDERYKTLEELCSKCNKNKIIIVKNEVCENVKDVNKKYKNYVNNGYEGAMVRSINGLYLTSNKKKTSELRSLDLLKLKPTTTDEFTCIGFKDGNGKDTGAIIWICVTKEGKQFNCTPKGITYDERKELFINCQKSFKKYKNKLITVEYQDISNDGVPQRAKAIGFRNVDSNGRPEY